MLNKEQYYTGTVVEVLDPVLYKIKVDIPGLSIGVEAFPMRGELDEPRVGDFVLLRSLDPIYNSYYLYQKIKENDFIGIRSNGKIVDITPDYIMLGIFDPTAEYNDKAENYRPDTDGNSMVTDWIKLDKEGNLTINLRSNSSINIVSDSTVKIGSNSNIEVSGNSDLKVNGNCTAKVSGNTVIDSPSVTIKGGQLTVEGNAAPNPSSGPFCALPNCAFTGAPHRGNIVSGT